MRRIFGRGLSSFFSFQKKGGVPILRATPLRSAGPCQSRDFAGPHQIELDRCGRLGGEPRASLVRYSAVPPSSPTASAASSSPRTNFERLEVIARLLLCLRTGKRRDVAGAVPHRHILEALSVSKPRPIGGPLRGDGFLEGATFTINPLPGFCSTARIQAHASSCNISVRDVAAYEYD